MRNAFKQGSDWNLVVAGVWWVVTLVASSAYIYNFPRPAWPWVVLIFAVMVLPTAFFMIRAGGDNHDEYDYLIEELPAEEQKLQDDDRKVEEEAATVEYHEIEAEQDAP